MSAGAITVPYGKNPVRFPLTLQGKNGGLVAPDAPPNILNVQINGSDSDENFVTIAQDSDDTPSPLIGAYTVSVDVSTAGLNANPNDDITVRGTVTVEGTEIVWQKLIIVAEFATNEPEVLVG